MNKMYSCNVLVLTYWPFEDGLIQGYTLPYVKMIRGNLSPEKEVWLRTLERENIDEKNDLIKRVLNKSKINWLPNSYLGYGYLSFFSSFIQLIKLFFFCYAKKIKVIHVWCTPPGIIGYILSILTGAELIIDSYEPHAEAMVENGLWEKNGLKFKILFFFEKLMSHRAKVIISATRGMRLYAKEKYGVSFDMFYVKPACVDLELFSFKKRKNMKLAKKLAINDKIVLVYAGKFGGIYLDDETFEFIKVLYEFYGDNFVFLLLTSHSREEIEGYCAKVDIPSEIIISRFVSHAEVPDYMGLADFAITPVKPVSSKRYCTPAKNGEYWALGLPVIITKDISDDSSIIVKENIGVVLETIDLEGFNLALSKLNVLLDGDRNKLNEKIRAVAVKYRSLEIAEKIYSQIYH